MCACRGLGIPGSVPLRVVKGGYRVVMCHDYTWSPWNSPFKGFLGGLGGLGSRGKGLCSHITLQQWRIKWTRRWTLGLWWHVWVPNNYCSGFNCTAEVLRRPCGEQAALMQRDL